MDKFLSFHVPFFDFFFLLGENVYVTLYGISNDINVRLDKNSLKLENTYISSASQRYFINKTFFVFLLLLDIDKMRY